MEVANLAKQIDSQSPKKRAEVLKKMGSYRDPAFRDFYIKYATSDSSSIVRREAISALGRLRDPLAIPVLTERLKDKDPKVAAQALRALVVFKDNQQALKEINKLSRHSNEMIRATVAKIKSNKKPQAVSILEAPAELQNLVVQGDVAKIMQSMPDESVHLTFTSPPYYNARDYTFYKSYSQYLDFLERIFKEVHRVTKEGRFFILNTSPVIVPRISRQYSSTRYPIPFDIHARLMNQGWEFIDDIIWLKPEASVKNRVGGFFQHRKPLGYKPNSVTEMVMVYRKKTAKLLDWNMRQYPMDVVNASKVNGEIDTSNVWKIDPKYDKMHSAVFPQKLCEKIIKYYSYKGDLVFDPFAGSGTLGVVAALQERNFLMAEIDEQYCQLMKERIDKVASSVLFEGQAPKYLNLRQFRKRLAK